MVTFDGSNKEITGNLSGSSSGSFKNINKSQIVGNDLYVGGTIFHKDNDKITFTDDDINITVGNMNFMDFTQLL